MRRQSHHQACLRARSSRQQGLPFPTNLLPLLQDTNYLMAHRPALEKLLTALLKSSEEAVLTVSPEGTIETWSAGAERLYGYAEEEMVGRSLRRLLPVYESPQLESLLAPSNGHSERVDVGERLHKNGSRVLVAVRRSVIRGDRG